jgi:hypothetical protein
MNPEDRVRMIDISKLETPDKENKQNSFYIWYKESDSDPNETQNMNKEYELIYQAAKEAELKSKLRVFTVSFVIFFSLVLLLLIFSPLLYREFFMTDEIPQIESSQTETIKPRQNINSNGLNQNPTQTPAVENNSPNQTPSVTSIADEKYNVIYIKLENGTFTIQESSWDSRDKASSRISKIESLGISGLNGNISEIMLGDNKTWFRVRLGSFPSLEEAQQKTGELMNALK